MMAQSELWGSQIVHKKDDIINLIEVTAPSICSCIDVIHKRMLR